MVRAALALLLIAGCSKKSEEPPPKVRPNVASITDIRVELIKRPEVKVAFTLRDAQGKAMTVHDADIKISFAQDKVRSDHPKVDLCDRTQHIDESIAIADKDGPRYELTYRMPDKENCIKPFRDLPVSAELSSYDFDGKGSIPSVTPDLREMLVQIEGYDPTTKWGPDPDLGDPAKLAADLAQLAKLVDAVPLPTSDNPVCGALPKVIDPPSISYDTLLHLAGRPAPPRDPEMSWLDSAGTRVLLQQREGKELFTDVDKKRALQQIETGRKLVRVYRITKLVMPALLAEAQRGNPGKFTQGELDGYVIFVNVETMQPVCWKAIHSTTSNKITVGGHFSSTEYLRGNFGTNVHRQFYRAERMMTVGVIPDDENFEREQMEELTGSATP